MVVDDAVIVRRLIARVSGARSDERIVVRAGTRSPAVPA
jgi:hypothetical protein